MLYLFDFHGKLCGCGVESLTCSDLLSQKVLQSSEARARQIPSESSSSFRLLPEPEPESEESRLLCGDLLVTRRR